MATTDAREAVSALLQEHGPKLHGLALRLCGNKADAEDLVQDVFLQAFRKWHTFRGEAKPSTWLYTIAVRACRRRMKRQRRAPKAVSQLAPWGETTVTAVATRDDADSPQRREAVVRVQQAIADLPEHFRVPIVLKEVLELSVEETADILGVAENTVKTRLHRARLALRKALLATSRQVSAPAPIFEKQVCLDLLKAKMSAMDQGGVARGFAVPQAEVCARCRAVFRELDIVQDACAQLSAGTMPAAMRDRIQRAITERDTGAGAAARRRAGRKPVGRA
jgi:RNA polymerase sigma-70 factor (ECF subfamily)